MRRHDDAARARLVALLASDARRHEARLVLPSRRAHQRVMPRIAQRPQSQQRRRASRADEQRAPRHVQRPLRPLRRNLVLFAHVSSFAHWSLSVSEVCCGAAYRRVARPSVLRTRGARAKASRWGATADRSVGPFVVRQNDERQMTGLPCLARSGAVPFEKPRPSHLFKSTGRAERRNRFGRSDQDRPESRPERALPSPSTKRRC